MPPRDLGAVRWTQGSIIFQGAQHALDPVIRIGAQIEEALLTHRIAEGREAEQRVAALLEMVGIPARRARSFPHELSGGQKQRVMIAMALACDPQLVIADEPTTALDVMVQAQVLALLRSLQSDLGLSMLFITHDLSVLAEVADDVAVMYAGRIVEEGPSDRGLLGAGPPLHEGVGGIVPEDRGRVVRPGAGRTGRRSSRPPRPAAWLHLPSAVSGGARRVLHDRSGQRRAGR